MPSTPVAYIDAAGMHVPTADEERAYFENGMRNIYGEDIVLDNSTMDGQMIGLLSDCLHDVNSSLFSSWQSFDPDASNGVRLDMIAKMNGLARAVSTFSTVDLRIIGQAGTVILAGRVADAFGYVWVMPDRVEIPETGEITVTATCSTKGAIQARAGTVSQIQTVERGWQVATNPNDAAPGTPVERDPAFRRRRALSTAVPARDALEAAEGAILAIPGVIACKAYENDTNVTDARGLPPHSIAFVVKGGDGQTIANMIRLKKSPGASTFGDNEFTTYNRAGVSRKTTFFRPKSVPVAYYLDVQPLQGYTVDVARAIRETLAAWTNNLPQGDPIARQRASIPAQLNGALASQTFILRDLKVARDGLTPLNRDVALSFYERPTCDPSNVLITPVKSGS